MQESPIFIKTFELLAWLLPFAQKFPKEQRFVLAAQKNPPRIKPRIHELKIRIQPSDEKIF